MRSVRAAAAIAAQENHASVLIAIENGVGQGFHLPRVNLLQFLANPLQERPGV